MTSPYDDDADPAPEAEQPEQPQGAEPELELELEAELEPEPEPESHHQPYRRQVAPEILEVAAALREAAAAAEAEPGRVWSTWETAELQWSQAGSQHAGRAHLTTPEGIVRLPFPEVATVALPRLRGATRDANRGAWLAAHVSIPRDSDEVAATFEWDERPYWNAPGERMVPGPGEAVPTQPMPTDEQWLADLRANPRTPELTPPWLRTSSALPGAAAADLRRRLDEVGYPREAVILPGEAEPGQPLEGAMEVRQVGSRFEVGVRDYGVFESFHTAPTEREACDWLWSYLAAPLPTPTPAPHHDLESRSAAYRPAYAQLYNQLQAGGGAILTTLPPGVALDRIGALDGVYLYPWATQMPMRALPPTSSQNVRVFQVLTTRPLTVEAEIVAPWFGQPGGSLRFRLSDDGTGVRQLVQSGTLLQVTVAP